jgi:membrane protein YqaA with SNARE-associated domain
VTEAEWMIFAAGCLAGGTVGYVVGNLVGAFRAARASSRTVRGVRR